MITFVAPLTVVLGAGLFASGILSFFGIHFFKSKTPERAALAGGLALIVLTEIIFATSGLSTRFLNGQRSDLLECRMEAESPLPLERHKGSRLIHEHIVQSMSGYGYEWREASRRCTEEPVSTNTFPLQTQYGLCRLCASIHSQTPAVWTNARPAGHP